MNVVLRGLLAGAAATALAGCSAMQLPDVERVAVEFATADPATRCALLAPTARSAVEHDEAAACAAVVGELAPPGGDVQDVQVWGDEAQVRLAADTLFLTRSESGWKVTAAGCTPNGEAPYECRLEAS